MLSFELILISLALLYFSIKRGLVYLHILQQDEYNPYKLLTWVKNNKAFDKRGSVLCLAVFVLSFFLSNSFLLNSLGALSLAVLATSLIDPRKNAKVKLHITQRAKRILYTFVIVNILVLFVLFQIHLLCPIKYYWISSIVYIQLIPLYFLLAVRFLQPFEDRIQNKFLSEARSIIQKNKPFIIGITGSFGKTSVKNYLGDVMQVTLGSTFWPPEAVNSHMGVTRAIRENLKAEHKYAIIEMAAYRLGSIAKHCDLTPPQAGIITAIGDAHLERFGSLDVTYQAKTELARAIPDDGILVCNADNELACKAGHEFKKATTVFYGINNKEANCQASNISFSKSGSTFDINWNSQNYQVTTKLLGETAISNLLATFSLLVSLGAKPELVALAMGNISPVKNRLELNKRGGMSFIDDAYNSNEKGFKAALEVMNVIDAPKKIVITPGVVELGEKQFEVNNLLAKEALGVADQIIFVGAPNRSAFKDAAGTSDNVFFADNRDQAFTKLAELSEKDALVLIENDLNDFHETRYRF